MQAACAKYSSPPFPAYPAIVHVVAESMNCLLITLIPPVEGIV